MSYGFSLTVAAPPPPPRTLLLPPHPSSLPSPSTIYSLPLLPPFSPSFSAILRLLRYV